MSELFTPLAVETFVVSVKEIHQEISKRHISDSDVVKISYNTSENMEADKKEEPYLPFLEDKEEDIWNDDNTSIDLSVNYEEDLYGKCQKL